MCCFTNTYSDPETNGLVELCNIVCEHFNLLKKELSVYVTQQLTVIKETTNRSLLIVGNQQLYKISVIEIRLIFFPLKNQHAFLFTQIQHAHSKK